ncbi:MAG: hypothetical protein COT88_00195 [Candidatus Colwellbacteria bacterium CG10_big_fil_rev_8_21_14_0_10_41_28]|uniref:Uncharacterized protein n=1 Tax=Candidatus Colwellbacteria bacterium CG10_big_fil_rev_8_21_14_0_10_41_28 TaxID=1974539 RepID=A0A2H0VHW7_9BACT|nr:MAG: hypothetical protein COT88_00195 [Candidatus Colwellbacteria bacterium CG10_big_fil_rev_8_21_14_0_10_41_28]
MFIYRRARLVRFRGEGFLVEMLEPETHEDVDACFFVPDKEFFLGPKIFGDKILPMEVPPRYRKEVGNDLVVVFSSKENSERIVGWSTIDRLEGAKRMLGASPEERLAFIGRRIPEERGQKLPFS